MDTSRIDNKTVLNTSLESFLSSGAIDVIMYEDATEGDSPLPIDADKQNNLAIGDRYTVFLNRLWTNNFFINLEYLGIGKTIFVNFETTRDFSFSLWNTGNRKAGITVIKRGLASEWGNSNVRNLENFFITDAKLREFNFTIFKENSYTYIIDVDVVELGPQWILDDGTWDMAGIWLNDGIWKWR